MALLEGGKPLGGGMEQKVLRFLGPYPLGDFIVPAHSVALFCFLAHDVSNVLHYTLPLLPSSIRTRV